jgi:hypothetical protein
MTASQIPSKLRLLFCFLITLLFSITWMNSSMAVPMRPTRPQPLPAYQEQFYSYLNDQKYTLSLGDDRGACAYSIDPTDVYERDNNRFVTAKVSQGLVGTACRGILNFQVLHADCQGKKLYQFQREEGTDPRRQGWQHLEMSLVKYTPPRFNESTRVTTEELAAQVCAMPTR